MRTHVLALVLPCWWQERGSHVAFNEGLLGRGSYHARISFDFLDAAFAASSARMSGSGGDGGVEGVVQPLAPPAMRGIVVPTRNAEPADAARKSAGANQV